MAPFTRERTLATRWKDLEEHRGRAADRAIVGDTGDVGKTQVLSWGKHKGVSFAKAWLDQDYVKWSCEHMHIQEVSGNRLAWLNYLSMRMAVEVEALGTLYPDTVTNTGSESTAEIGTSRRLAALEARMWCVEQLMERILAAVSDSIPGGNEPSD